MIEIQNCKAGIFTHRINSPKYTISNHIIIFFTIAISAQSPIGSGNNALFSKKNAGRKEHRKLPVRSIIELRVKTKCYK